MILMVCTVPCTSAVVYSPWSNPIMFLILCSILSQLLDGSCVRDMRLKWEHEMASAASLQYNGFFIVNKVNLYMAALLFVKGKTQVSKMLNVAMYSFCETTCEGKVPRTSSLPFLLTQLQLSTSTPRQLMKPDFVERCLFFTLCAVYLVKLHALQRVGFNDQINRFDL